MFKTPLAKAVKQFVNITHSLTDADLNREWAWGAYDSEGVRY